MLTPDPARHADRALAAAWAKCDAGSLDEALRLLAAVDAGPPDPMRAAQAAHLSGQIAFDRAHGAAAARLLLNSARQLEPLDPRLARDTHLEAPSAAMWASNPATPATLVEAARAARSAPPAPDSPRASDLLLDGLALRLTDGYTAAAPALTAALEAARTTDIRADDVGRLLWMVGNRVSGVAAIEVWDFDAGYELARRQVRLARDAGALVQLQYALNFLANYELLAGRLDEAALLVEEDRLVGAATGHPTVGYAAMALAAFRGQEQMAHERITAETSEEAAQQRGRIVSFASYASAVLYNGLAHYEAACAAAREIFDHDVLGYRSLVVGELAEAALRTGDRQHVLDAADWLAERAQITPTPWATGMQARVQAMLADGDQADALYRTSIDDLAATPLRAELARSHLLYGEWLRREGQRVEARAQLHTAHDMLSAMGMAGFAERARQELTATGATARKRSVETEFRPDGPGSSDRPAGPRRVLEPRDRPAAVSQPAHRRMAHEPRPQQVGRPVAPAVARDRRRAAAGRRRAGDCLTPGTCPGVLRARRACARRHVVPRQTSSAQGATAMSSNQLTVERPLTRDESSTLFSQTMGLVALTAATFTLGAYLARDVGPGWGWSFFIAAFAALFGMYPAVQRSSQLSVGLLLGFGFLIGASVAPTVAYYASADPQALWEAGGATALFVAGFGAAGYATRRDLSKLGPGLSWALLGLIVFGIIAVLVQVPNGSVLYAVAGLVIFAGLVAYDFERLRQTKDIRIAPLLAASIFLDILNVFLLFLSLGTGRDE
jgi:FtsH-binding integral membrane protein